MDAGSLAKYIKELLSERDRVGVPGLGFFYTQAMPARFSEDRNTIYPPCRKLLFRKEEVSQEAEELFSMLVSRVSGLPLEEAGTEITWCISRLNSELSSSGTCALPGLGELKAESRGEISFVPEGDLPMSIEGLDMQPVSLKMKAVPKPAKAAAAQQKQPSAGKILLWSAIFLLVLTALLFAVVFIFRDSIIPPVEGINYIRL